MRVTAPADSVQLPQLAKRRTAFNAKVGDDEEAAVWAVIPAAAAATAVAVAVPKPDSVMGSCVAPVVPDAVPTATFQRSAPASFANAATSRGALVAALMTQLVVPPLMVSVAVAPASSRTALTSAVVTPSDVSCAATAAATAAAVVVLHVPVPASASVALENAPSGGGRGGGLGGGGGGLAYGVTAPHPNCELGGAYRGPVNGGDGGRSVAYRVSGGGLGYGGLGGGGGTAVQFCVAPQMACT